MSIFQFQYWYWFSLIFNFGAFGHALVRQINKWDKLIETGDTGKTVNTCKTGKIGKTSKICKANYLHGLCI